MSAKPHGNSLSGDAVTGCDTGEPITPKHTLARDKRRNPSLPVTRHSVTAARRDASPPSHVSEPGASQASVTLAVPREVLEALAQRAAAIVLERLAIETAPASEYLSVAEAAELIRAKPQRVYDLLSAGRLTRLKDGSRVLVNRAEIEAYLR
jgi:excisionase family DNA binding protein